jgi:hypothetical protein
MVSAMRLVPTSMIQWAAFAIGAVGAGLLWAVDVQAFLLSLGADRIIWFPITVLWLEIAFIIAALIRRHIAGRPAVGRGSILLAWGAAAVNLAFIVMVGFTSPLM